MTWRPSLPWLVVLPLLAVTACGGGSEKTTGPEPGFAMSVTPGSLTLQAGAAGMAYGAESGRAVSLAALPAMSGNVSVSIERSGGFSGAVSITVEGLPTGVSATGATIPSGGNSASLTITASGSATAGNTTLTVRGTGSGVTARTATLQLVVTEPPAISVSLTPAAVSIAQGQSGSSAAALSRTGGYSGAVTLSATGAPSGMIVSFDPSPTSGNASTITVNVGSGVSTGTYQITVQASGSGVASSAAILTVTVTQPPSSSVSLAATPASLTIQQGGTGNSILNLTRTNFAGSVTLTASGVPAGMTVTFNPPATSGNTSSISVVAGSGTAPGTYVITLTGTATGISDATSTISVTVSASAGSISLSVLPTSLTIQQGSSGNATLTINRGAFAGPVDLTATGVPANVTVGFTPASTTGTSSSVSVSVGSGAAVGTYQITLRGSGSGVAESIANLSIMITPSGGGSGSVSMTFCAQSGIPLWFAYQSQGGPWTQVTGAGGVYQFSVTDRGGVAWVTDEGNGNTSMTILYGSVTELNMRTVNQCVGTGQVKTLTGSVSNLGPTDIATIQMGSSSATVLGALPGPFQLTDVPDAPLDLLATRTPFGAGQPNSVLIKARDYNPANGTDLGVLDLGQGVPPVQHTATIGNLGGDQASVFTSFMTKNSTMIPLSTLPASAATMQQWYGMPDASTIPGDWHLQTIRATPGTGVSFPYRSITQFNRLAADRTYSLPPYLQVAPTFVMAQSDPYVAINSTWSIPSTDYDDFWSLILQPATGTVQYVFIAGSAGYFGSGPVQLNLPVLGAGFNPAWGIQKNVSVTWSFTATGGAVWDLNNPTGIVEGAVAKTAALSGSFVTTPIH